MNKPPGRLVGVDYGTVRIGLAISDPEQRIASPLKTYTRSGSEADAKFFTNLAEEEQVQRFVVGLPVYASGDESAKSREARQFGAWLHELTELPVDYYDERYSSVAAESILTLGGLTSKKRKQRRDALAAQIILSAYLESAERGAAEPGQLDD